MPKKKKKKNEDHTAIQASRARLARKKHFLHLSFTSLSRYMLYMYEYMFVVQNFGDEWIKSGVEK